ncbi:GTP pyrophosphokinase [Corynebacterium sp. H113]|uniref:GTP pyrophosphokinase n=1 Tax=Corynebacterium sp. H113 TaxID=3133419 RepID=UPI003095F978
MSKQQDQPARPQTRKKRRKISERMRTLQSQYDSWLAAHPTAAADFADGISEILADSGLAFDQVTARVKTWRSLRMKAMRRRDDGSFVYADPWADIHDLVGARITTYHSTEIPSVLEVLADDLDILRTTDKTLETRISGQLGYGSHHLVCRIGENAPNILEPYKGLEFEIQVRTVLQHAWAEFEHDIRYKSAEGVVDPRIDRAFALAAGLIELADQQFDQIASIIDEQEQEAASAQDSDSTTSDATGRDSSPNRADDVEINAETLPGVLTLFLPRIPRSKSEHYAWLEDILDANGVDTVGELRKLLEPRRVDQVSKAMRYRFTPGHARIIDDCLLAEFGEDHITQTQHLGLHPEARVKRMKVRLAILDKAEAVTETGVIDREVDQSADVPSLSDALLPDLASE